MTPAHAVAIASLVAFISPAWSADVDRLASAQGCPGRLAAQVDVADARFTSSKPLPKPMLELQGATYYERLRGAEAPTIFKPSKGGQKGLWFWDSPPADVEEKFFLCSYGLQGVAWVETKRLVDLSVTRCWAQQRQGAPDRREPYAYCE